MLINSLQRIDRDQTERPYRATVSQQTAVEQQQSRTTTSRRTDSPPLDSRQTDRVFCRCCWLVELARCRPSSLFLLKQKKFVSSTNQHNVHGRVSRNSYQIINLHLFPQNGPIPEVLQYRANPWRSLGKPEAASSVQR